VKRLLHLCERLERGVTRVSGAAAIVLIPVLLCAAAVPVLGRNVHAAWAQYTGTLQPVQVPLFFAIVMLSLGMILLRDEHVRIDLLRRRQSRRQRAWVDLAGGVGVLLPFSLALVGFGTRFTVQSYAMGETADVVWDYPIMWMVKAMIPAGGALLFLAGLAAAVRNAAALRASPARPAGTDAGRN
jgi:TRAP-type mannitol/chloroaromatic compound transport system permease small subunit